MKMIWVLSKSHDVKSRDESQPRDSQSRESQSRDETRPSLHLILFELENSKLNNIILKYIIYFNYKILN